jgi:hypothetical protein
MLKEAQMLQLVLNQNVGLKTSKVGKRNMRYTTKITIGLGLAFSLLTSHIGFAQVASEHRIPLANFLVESDIAKEDLGNAVTIKAPEESQWISGIVGKIRPAFFSIAPNSRGQERIARSLKVSFNPIFLQPMSFAACDADGDCRTLSASAAGSSLTFSHEGVSWEVSSPDSPCHTYVCSFTIPAWSLEMRRQKGVNGWKSFPALATILDHPTGITIFDSRNGSKWASFLLKASSGPGSNLGKLLDASLSDGGLLNLKYESGALLLDFQTDRIFAIAENGVFFANEGLGLAQESQSQITWQELAFAQGRGKVLVANQELIIWEDRAVRWSARSQGIRKSNGTNIELPGIPSTGEANRTLLGSVVDILVTEDSRITQWRYNPVKNAFEEIRSEQVKSGETYSLVSGILGLVPPEEPCIPSMLALCTLGAKPLEMSGYTTASILVGSEIKVSILIK